MSFFGFDPSAPPASRQQQHQETGEVYDFQDTYDGLGDQLDEEDDALNSQTFGGTGEIRKDFDFGGKPVQNRQPAPPPQNLSYAQAATTNDEEFMQDLWGSSHSPAPAPPQGETQSEKRILSLEEIEAQLTAIDQSQQQVHPHQHQQFPPQYGMPGMMPHPAQFGGYMMPPGGFMPPPGQFGQYPPMGMPQGYQMPIPPQFQHPQQPPQQQPQPPQQPPQQQPQQQPQQLQHPQQVPVQQPVQQPVPQAQHISSQEQAVPAAQRDMSHFPLLGSKEAQHATSEPQQKEVQSPRGDQQPQLQQPHHHNGHHHHHYHHQNVQDMTPEQQEKFARRQEKVMRIMNYSGIMNPKDKDFVTRFQLSQIVTEDPYNEDFYAQVYKAIHPKANKPTAPQQLQLLQQNPHHNSIAQAYLEQSGHRLGGRQMRVDIALQRMQQQVQKAVTVAKDRPKLSQYSKEGALGKISFGSGKKPRQQLEIISKAAQRELEKKEAGTAGFKERSPSVSRSIRKYTKKDIMSILENIITELMNVESESRTSTDVDTTKLWESLKVLEQPSSLGDDEAEVNPFVQCLNYNKALKILLRLVKFLSREQVLTIVTLIMSNLENLSVIKNGSYTTYPDKKVPAAITKLVEAYSLTFTKVLMNAALDFKFNEIIGLLVILIEHNNVSFVSTTKIGLSILTTLISRAELIIGEGSISATDLSEWSSCYDELFTSLESRIAAIFPPHEDGEDVGATSSDNYVWQFLATLSLGGKLSHQRIIVDEVRDEIFSVMARAKAIDNSDLQNLYKKQNLLNNLNMYLVVMGLVADENEIKELQN